MNINQLRIVIERARTHEGVNWYLTDRTPDINAPGQVFTLYGYDDDNDLVLEIPHIEERLLGQIDPEVQASVENARVRCGMNSAFARRKSTKRQLPDRRDEYRRCQAIWLLKPQF